jgi:anthranilate phosphoribosyltransferase
MQSIFHPGYQVIHQEAELLLGQPRMAVIKGDGGEVECNPDGECTVFTVEDGVAGEELWPAFFSRRHVKPAELDTDILIRVWRGESEDDYGLGAILMTMAITLKMMGRASSQEQAIEMAKQIWQQRKRACLE